MLMRDIRAVVTDLDGTVVDGDGRVSAATVRAAADLAARGIPLALATARTPAWVAGLDSLVPWVTIAVCCGGSVAWVPRTGELLWRETIPPGSVAAIIEAVGRHLPGAGIGAFDGERWSVTETFATLGPARRGQRMIVPAEKIAASPVCALTVAHPGSGPDELSRVLSAVEPPLTAAYGKPGVVDLAPAGIGKGAGVARALAGVGVDPGHAIAFGDMPGDLPMLALCGCGVAVANAHPDVLAAATIIAACVHDDGFARTLASLSLASAVPDRGAPGCACSPAPG